MRLVPLKILRLCRRCQVMRVCAVVETWGLGRVERVRWPRQKRMGMLKGSRPHPNRRGEGC